MIAVGCENTKSMPKYISRLAVFAIISEPFYIAAMKLSWKLFDIQVDAQIRNQILNELSNILFLRFSNTISTLCCGAICIYIYQKLNDTKLKKAKWLILIPILLVMCLWATMSHFDYGWYGLLLVFFIYVTKATFRYITIIAWSVITYGCIVPFIRGGAEEFSSVEGVIMIIANIAIACLGALLITQFTLDRHRKRKWFFYIYYPAHLFALVMLNTFLHHILK
jgi:hypothetical protein